MKDMTPKRAMLGLLVACGMALGTAQPIQAEPITVDGGWVKFCFGPPPMAAFGDCGSGFTGPPFTFTSAGPVLFKITDAFSGPVDGFSVYDFGSFLLTTPPGTGGGTVTDPDVAFADPRYSHASMILAPGDHSLEVFTAFGGSGGAYLEVESITAPVPEPATLLLLGSGLAGLGAWRRHRRK